MVELWVPVVSTIVNSLLMIIGALLHRRLFRRIRHTNRTQRHTPLERTLSIILITLPTTLTVGTLVTWLAYLHQTMVAYVFLVLPLLHFAVMGFAYQCFDHDDNPNRPHDMQDPRIFFSATEVVKPETDAL